MLYVDFNQWGVYKKPMYIFHAGGLIVNICVQEDIVRDIQVHEK